MGCYGDDVAIFTNNGKLAQTLRAIRVHGKGENKYDNIRTGINGSLDTLQAAILLEKLAIFPEEILDRNAVADSYRNRLDSGVITPTVPDGYMSVWAQFSVLAESSDHRQQLMDNLKGNNIPTAIYYPKPLHLQGAFAHLEYSDGDFPVAEDMASRILSLPMHPYVTEAEIQTIANALNLM